MDSSPGKSRLQVQLQLIKKTQYNDGRYGTLDMYLCIMEWNVIGIIGIGVELPSSELELNCLRDFVPESELNWKILLLLELNCENGIDPGSDNSKNKYHTLVFYL